MANQLTTSELEQKRGKLGKWIKGITLAFAGLFVSPIIFLAVGGIVGLTIAAAVGFTIVQLAPWFALKVANLKYRLMDAEKVAHIQKVTEAAAENPIETLTALLLSKRKAFTEFQRNVENAIAARDTFKTKVEKFKKQYPARAPEFEAQVARMVSLIEKKKIALRDAQKSLDEGDAKLEEMKAYWEMSKDAIELNKAAGMDTGDAFEKLKADTACDSVFTAMNTAFAQLEVAAALDVNSVDAPTTSVAQLAHSEPIVLTSTIQDVQKVNR